MGKLISLHQIIVEAHDRSVFVVRETQFTQTQVLFENNFTIHIQKSFEASLRHDVLTEKATPETEKVRTTMANSGNVDALSEAQFEVLEAAVPSAIRTTSIAVHRNQMSLRFSGKEEYLQSIKKSWKIPVGGSFNLTKIFKAIEFISKVRSVSMKIFKEVYGDDAGKSLEEFFDITHTFGFNFDIFTISKVLQIFSIEEEKHEDGSGHIEIVIDFKKALDLVGLRKEVEIFGKTFLESFTVSLYNSFSFMESMDELKEQRKNIDDKK